MERPDLQRLFPDDSERAAAHYLLAAGASPLDEYTKQAIRSGRPRILNLSSADDPQPLLYVTEQRIKHKFSQPPQFMRFSFPQRLLLLRPDDEFYERAVPIAYLRLEDEIENYSLDQEAVKRMGSFPHRTATEYRVSIDYLFHSSDRLEQRFSALRSPSAPQISVPEKQVAHEKYVSAPSSASYS